MLDRLKSLGQSDIQPLPDRLKKFSSQIVYIPRSEIDLCVTSFLDKMHLEKQLAERLRTDFPNDTQLMLRATAASSAGEIAGINELRRKPYTVSDVLQILETGYDENPDSFCYPPGIRGVTKFTHKGVPILGATINALINNFSEIRQTVPEEDQEHIHSILIVYDEKNVLFSSSDSQESYKNFGVGMLRFPVLMPPVRKIYMFE